MAGASPQGQLHLPEAQGEQAEGGHGTVVEEGLPHAVAEGMDLIPAHARRVDDVDEVGQKPQEDELILETGEKGVAAAEHTAQAHGGAGVEGKLLHVDLPVGQGHEEQVGHVQPEGGVEGGGDGTVLGLVGTVFQQENDR